MTEQIKSKMSEADKTIENTTADEIWDSAAATLLLLFFL